MKISLFLAVLFLSACNHSNQNNKLFWDYNPYEKKPRITLEQAHAICNGPAKNNANASYNNKTYGGNDIGSQIAASYINKNNRQSAYNNTYTSCLAQNGWKAELKRSQYPSLVKCRKKNGDIIEVKISPNACLHNGGTIL